jgi:hypothetical protein
MSAELAGLEELMRRLEKHRESDIMASDPTHRRDAVNLVHYLALRQGDVRDLQRWGSVVLSANLAPNLGVRA